MHSNTWGTLYLTLIPSALFFLLAIISGLMKGRISRLLLVIGAGLLIIPATFLVAHFASLNSEMALRSGKYIVVQQENLQGSCSGSRFDNLQLTLKKDGNFSFNYKPCFADKATGNWEWTDNMVHSYSRFDKFNDSLHLRFPSEFNPDTLELTNYNKRFLTFAKAR